MAESFGNIRELKGLADLELGFAVLRELRTVLTYQDFSSILAQSQVSSSYRFVGLFDGDQIVAVMGCRILFDFVHGKHLYVDDLVTRNESRGKGHGATLLKYAEEVARQENCKSLRLCTGVDNNQAKKFYEREGWQARSVAYKKVTCQ